MKDPVQKWQDSGTEKNHRNCSGCHFDNDFRGWMAMNKSAVVQVIEHFRRDPEEPLSPPEEPLFLEGDKEPGYWSLVPNHRCFQCHDAPNHKPIDQPRIHAKLISDIANQPCKDCHNHEMRNGQKFFEKALAESETASPLGGQT
jgi:trimethylamine-N-oxide reductase (cytochrome c) cytochrome c-type subunit TorY